MARRRFARLEAYATGACHIDVLWHWKLARDPVSIRTLAGVGHGSRTSATSSCTAFAMRSSTSPAQRRAGRPYSYSRAPPS